MKIITIEEHITDSPIKCCLAKPFVENAPISDEDKRHIAFKYAERLFQIR